jgi:hypothetical protein
VLFHPCSYRCDITNPFELFFVQQLIAVQQHFDLTAGLTDAFDVFVINSIVDLRRWENIPFGDVKNLSHAVDNQADRDLPNVDADDTSPVVIFPRFF